MWHLLKTLWSKLTRYIAKLHCIDIGQDSMVVITLHLLITWILGLGPFSFIMVARVAYL